MSAGDDPTVAALSAWTAVESPTHHAPGVNAMMNLVVAEAREADIAHERIPGRDGLGDMVILRAGPRNSEKSTLVLSHLDTVHPVGTVARDLPVRVEGDRLFGPGIYDMKGGAWLALQAFKQAAKSKNLQRPLVFLFTPDEEIGSPISRAVIEKLAREAAFSLVTEPARDGGKCVTGRKGVGRFDVEIEGRPAHAGARHSDGRSAIREAARLILAVEAMTDYTRGVTTTVGMMQGGTAANVIPQKASFCIDLRVVTDEDGHHFADNILRLTAFNPDVKVTVTGAMNRPPMERTAEGAALYGQAAAIARKIGVTLGEVPLTGGGSDGNFTAALGVPTLDGLGIDGDGAHTLQEYGLLSSVAPRQALMRGLLETL
ncbi:MAG: M20 family metallopeptidase [Beijerinckiaceae bacterium]